MHRVWLATGRAVPGYAFLAPRVQSAMTTKKMGRGNAMEPTEVAGVLMAWHEGRQTFVPFAREYGIEQLDQAYNVQDALVDRRCKARTAAPVGYKIGLTSPRMQAMCGIDSPIAGVILDPDVHSSGTTLSKSHYGRLGIEFEIGVRIGRDLEAAGLPKTIAELRDFVEGVCPAVEIVDDRNADYSTGLDVLSLVADNSWNAGVVLGAFRQDWPDLDTVKATVKLNGTVVDRGTGGDVLGHPFESVLWLARHLAFRGRSLRRGQIVLTGSIVPTRFPADGESYELQLDGLGSVALQIAP
jgi:2-keto-4-pentenoate hydratase